jgi:hypothetical protein
LTVINYIGLVSSIFTIVGGIAGIIGLVMSRMANDRPVNRDEGLSIGDEAIKNLRDRLQLINNKIGYDLPLLTRAEFNTAATALRDEVTKVLTEVAEQQTRSAIKTLRNQLKDLAALERTQEIQDSLGRLVQAQEKLRINLLESNQTVTGVVEGMPEVIKSLGNQINEQLKQTVKESIASSGVSVKVSDEIEDKVKKEVLQGDGGDIMGPDIVD